MMMSVITMIMEYFIYFINLSSFSFVDQVSDREWNGGSESGFIIVVGLIYEKVEFHLSITIPDDDDDDECYKDDNGILHLYYQFIFFFFCWPGIW